jgi:hypothetical protein
VVVTSLWALFPFVHRSTTPLSAYSILSRKVLGQESMGLGTRSKKGQAAPAPHRNGKSSMHKGFPVVGVIDHVTNRAFPMDVWDSPVVSYAIPGATFVLRERLAGCSDEPPVAWDYDASMGALPTKLVNHIGRSSPVCIDQASLDSHHGTVIPSPFPTNQITS